MTLPFPTLATMSGRPSAYETDVLPFVRPFTDALVASVAVPAVHDLLDHGSGTGEVVMQLRRAGLDASVVAVEPSGEMIRRLRENLHGVPRSEAFHGLLADYVQHSPERRFDLVTSQLVLSFVPDPLREL